MQVRHGFGFSKKKPRGVHFFALQVAEQRAQCAFVFYGARFGRGVGEKMFSPNGDLCFSSKIGVATRALPADCRREGHTARIMNSHPTDINCTRPPHLVSKE